MDHWGPLFDLPSAAALRDRGMALASAADLTDHIDRALSAAARIHPELTSDEVWAELERRGVRYLEHPNALGAAFRRAALSGLLESTSTVRKSARPSAHRRNLVVWRSTVFGVTP